MGALVWLASYPKSGNTWLRVFLHNLLRDPAKPMNINEIDSFTLGDSHVAWYQKFTDRPQEQLSLTELAELCDEAAEQAAGPDRGGMTMEGCRRVLTDRTRATETLLTGISKASKMLRGLQMQGMRALDEEQSRH